MKNNVIAGFIVNLLQDINILRPLIYLAADDMDSSLHLGY